MLEKIIDVQKVGRFEKLHSPNNVKFTKATLIFGENGWGKSTLADILRSFGSNRPEILHGRETLATGGAQKAILLFAGGKQAAFTDGAWAGNPPRIAVYDQTFINENVYSGETVSHDHLKKQHGLVMGAEGVSILRDIQALEAREKVIKENIKEKEREIQTIMLGLGLARISLFAFSNLEPLPDAEAIIETTETNLKRVTERNQIQNATLPELLPVPTPAADLKLTLECTIEGVAVEARERVQNHITAHAKFVANPSIPHETWLETGLAFSAEEDCPFCGQELRDRELIDIYASYFSASFKALSEDVKKRRKTLARYEAGDFRKAISTTIRANKAVIENLTNLTREEFVGNIQDAVFIKQIENAAKTIDSAFLEKQEDLASAPDLTAYSNAFDEWDIARKKIESFNRSVEDYRSKITTIRNAQQSANIETLVDELAVLRGRVKRHEEDASAIIVAYNTLLENQKRLKTQKGKRRGELKDYSANVTARLGSTINAHLKGLGAGFRIKYDPPNFKGQEPAAAYALMINETEVSPRADNLATPSFRNTLSTGDKSVLALALFLATVNSVNDIADMIVVLDDPFTSMDDFRRSFTANEINKLTLKAAQVIVLSHEKGFLRLLWERLGSSALSTFAIQTGAPGMASLVAFNIEQATKPREETERDKVLQFLEVTEGDPDEIRSLLRNVLENFYRKGDPELFDDNELLLGILNKIKSAPEGYRYKAAIPQLEDINFYTRTSHHAPVSGIASEMTSVEELKNYCELVRDLTRGAV